MHLKSQVCAMDINLSTFVEISGRSRASILWSTDVSIDAVEIPPPQFFEEVVLKKLIPITLKRCFQRSTCGIISADMESLI